MASNTKDIGDISEWTLIARLMKQGYRVLKPLGDNSRYDFVIEKDSMFLKVQAKTGQLKNGVVQFRVCSSATMRGNDRVHRSYEGEIDLFGVYCPDNDKCYLVPVKGLPRYIAVLRVDPPKSVNQHNANRLAADYEISDDNNYLCSIRAEIRQATIEGQPIRETGHREPVLCKSCKTELELSQKIYCSYACYGMDTRKISRPSYAQLMKDLSDMPMTKVGAKYGVSDNAVRKWIRAYENMSAPN